MIQVTYPRSAESSQSLPSLLQIPAIYFLLAWAGLGLVGSMILSGRRNLMVIVLVTLFLAPMIPALADGAGAPSAVVVALRLAETWVFVLVTIGGTIAAFVYATVKKRVHVYLTLAALLLFIGLNLINWNLIWPNHFSILRSLVMVCALTLPLAPLALAPLALAWNRHR